MAGTVIGLWALQRRWTAVQGVAVAGLLLLGALRLPADLFHPEGFEYYGQISALNMRVTAPIPTARMATVMTACMTTPSCC